MNINSQMQTVIRRALSAAYMDTKKVVTSVEFVGYLAV